MELKLQYGAQFILFIFTNMKFGAVADIYMAKMF